MAIKALTVFIKKRKINVAIKIQEILKNLIVMLTLFYEEKGG